MGPTPTSPYAVSTIAMIVFFALVAITAFVTDSAVLRVCEGIAAAVAAVALALRR